MAYFQIPWAEKSGALQTFGVEVAVVAGLFLIIVPTLQLKGAALRVSDKPSSSGGILMDLYRSATPRNGSNLIIFSAKT